MTAPLWRQLADRLTQEIRSGQRAPGSKLPSYAELAEQRLSQATVARAYRNLADQGLLVPVHGAGSYVADPLPPPAQPVTEVLAAYEARISALEQQVADLIQLVRNLGS